MEHPSYYAIIPSEVRYSSNLKANSKLMYGEITALSNKHGYCYASNNYFAELYGVSKNTISLWINQLVKEGFIKSLIIKTERNQVKERRISLTNNIVGGIPKNDEDNNTSINTTSINTISIREQKFVHDVSLIYYDKNIKKEFCEYWCERNPKGSKLKFEMERTFDINLRFKRWIKNNEKWNKNFQKPSQKSNIETTINTHQKAKEMMNSINNGESS